MKRGPGSVIRSFSVTLYSKQDNNDNDTNIRYIMDLQYTLYLFEI